MYLLGITVRDFVLLLGVVGPVFTTALPLSGNDTLASRSLPQLAARDDSGEFIVNDTLTPSALHQLAARDDSGVEPVNFELSFPSPEPEHLHEYQEVFPLHKATDQIGVYMYQMKPAFDHFGIKFQIARMSGPAYLHVRSRQMKVSMRAQGQPAPGAKKIESGWYHWSEMTWKSPEPFTPTRASIVWNGEDKVNLDLGKRDLSEALTWTLVDDPKTYHAKVEPLGVVFTELTV
ncbi:hypothetical protein EV361DRAFT_896645 [Lentinula raphanica]|nr:hypothetical protein F5880DRAFT_761636 [Lentinula raphanica]KAJ3974045.1 hypothetical protein EV361DRAFT_896645 [Lentinula raphanica]